MTMTYKRLAALDLNGTVGTGETLYQCTATSAIVSTLVICNRDSAAHTYRVGVSTTSSYADAGMLVYGTTVAANDSVPLTLGITLDATNCYLLVSGDNTAMSASAFGVEIA
jgi:hypothetical protein